MYSRILFLLLLGIFFQSNSMKKEEPKKDSYRISREKKGVIKELFKGKESTIIGLIDQSLALHNITKHRNGEFTIGSFNGQTGYGTLYPEPDKPFDCKLLSLKSLLEGKRNNELFSDGDCEPCPETQHFIVKPEAKSDKKKCCCKLY